MLESLLECWLAFFNRLLLLWGSFFFGGVYCLFFFAPSTQVLCQSWHLQAGTWSWTSYRFGALIQGLAMMGIAIDWGQAIRYTYRCCIPHDGSMVLVYMLTSRGYIDGKCYHIYIAHRDPMGTLYTPFADTPISPVEQYFTGCCQRKSQQDGGVNIMDNGFQCERPPESYETSTGHDRTMWNGGQAIAPRVRLFYQQLDVFHKEFQDISGA